MILSNNRFDLIGAGLEFYNNKVSKLINCEVVFRSDSSISFHETQNITVSDCDISSPSGDGSLVEGLDLNTAEEIVVSECVFSNLRTGINMPLWEQKSIFPISISRNTFQNCHIGMFLGGIGSYDIKYNQFLSNDIGLYFQIAEEPYAENKLRYNKFEGNTMDIKSYSGFWPDQYFIEFEENEFDNPKGSQWTYSTTLFKVFFYISIASVGALVLNFIGRIISKLKKRDKSAGDEGVDDNLEVQKSLKSKEAIEFDW